MDGVFIDLRCQNKWIRERFPKVDFVSVEDFLSEFETLLDEISTLETKLQDLKQDVEDNYQPIRYQDQL